MWPLVLLGVGHSAEVAQLQVANTRLKAAPDASPCNLTCDNTLDPISEIVERQIDRTKRKFDVSHSNEPLGRGKTEKEMEQEPDSIDRCHRLKSRTQILLSVLFSYHDVIGQG